MDPVELGINSLELGGLFAGVLALTLMTRIALYCCNDTPRVTVSNMDLLKHLESISADLDELKQTVSQLQTGNTFVFETESDSETSHDQEQEQEQEQEQDVSEQEQESPQVPVQAVVAAESNPKDAKHAQLRQKMKDGTELYVSYKKTTFVGKYVVKADAQNGYVIQHNGADYLTPSQFSFKMKRAINPAIPSDNGWDSIHILTGLDEKGKQIKMSLKDYINTA
jgi:hypothetical protein